MKNLIVLPLFLGSLMIALPGCGESGPTSVTAGVEKSEMEKYQEAVEQLAKEDGEAFEEGDPLEGAQ